MPKTSPLTPFAVIYRCSLFSRCSLPLFPYFFLSPRLLFSLRPVAACATIHLSSRFLVHDGKTRDRVGNNVPGKKPRRERRIFSSCLPLRSSRSLARLVLLLSRVVEFRRSTLHVFAGKKDSAGVSFLAGYRGTTGYGKGNRGEGETGGRPRERWREMIIHSAVITRSPAP